MKRKLFASMMVGLSMLFGVAVTLALSKQWSQPWAEEQRRSAIQRLTLTGLEAAARKDWLQAASMYDAVTELEKQSNIGAWSWSFPLVAWTLPIASSNEREVINEAMVAYALEQAGLHDEAEKRFSALGKRYPQWTPAALRQLAAAIVEKTK